MRNDKTRTSLRAPGLTFHFSRIFTTLDYKAHSWLRSECRIQLTGINYCAQGTELTTCCILPNVCRCRHEESVYTMNIINSCESLSIYVYLYLLKAKSHLSLDIFINKFKIYTGI